MKKTLLFTLIFCAPLFLIAQEDDTKEPPKQGWTGSGEFSLLFNQAAFNAEWTGGGTTNYSGNIKLTYDFNYRKGKLTWDNRILGDYGITKNRGEDFSKKTNDRLEFNSIVGRQIRESDWYYSFFLNFKSQFAAGFEYDKDENGRNFRTETTHFLSPAYLQLGPGILWKKNDNLKVNFAPGTAKLIFVDKKFTKVNESLPGILDAYNENKYFGVDANKTTRFEFGASVSAYAKFDVLANISAENILNLYSNYLEDPQNVDIDYTLNLVLKVNRYISTNVTFQAIYDDNAVKGFQIREALGVGVTYGF